MDSDENSFGIQGDFVNVADAKSMSLSDAMHAKDELVEIFQHSFAKWCPRFQISYESLCSRFSLTHNITGIDDGRYLQVDLGSSE
jgi:hypothetical protein